MHTGATTRSTLWDVQNASALRSLLPHVNNTNSTNTNSTTNTDTGLPLRELCAKVLDHFEARVKPMLPLLRRQVVHGDFNMTNVLVQDGKVSGVVEFENLHTFTSSTPLLFPSLPFHLFFTS
jgi:aminoglycoside phosphotransferase